MPRPQRLGFVSDNDHYEPDEGNPKRTNSEQLDLHRGNLPEEEKKEGRLSNRKHQNFAQKVESEVKENMKEAEHVLLQQLGVEELDNPINVLQGQNEQLDGGSEHLIDD